MAVVQLCISIMTHNQTLLRDEHSFMLLFVRGHVALYVCSRRRATHIVLSVVREVAGGVAGGGGVTRCGEVGVV